MIWNICRIAHPSPVIIWQRKFLFAQKQKQQKQSDFCFIHTFQGYMKMQFDKFTKTFRNPLYESDSVLF